MLPEVLGGMLAADAVMTLEHDWRIAVQEQQRIVIRLVEQARALDPGDRALLLGANVDQLQSGAALELLPQLRRRELANRRRFVGRNGPVCRNECAAAKGAPRSIPRRCQSAGVVTSSTSMASPKPT